MIHSFGLMKTDIHESNDFKVKELIMQLCQIIMMERYNDANASKDVSTCLVGLGRLSFNWSTDISENNKKQIEDRLISILSYMSEQQVANTIHALGSLRADWFNLP